MPTKSRLTVIWGGQFGSEGKGQIAAFLASKTDAAVRVGGPNAGHTFYYPNGKKEVVQSVPIAAMLGAQGVIGAAGVLIPDLLLAELQRGHKFLGKPVQLIISENAAVITPEHMQTERELMKRIGSTGEGVGAVTAQKVMREAVTVGEWDLEGKLMELDPEACSGVEIEPDTAYQLNYWLRERAMHMMVEGTQGFGLSLHNGGYYPYCTSRECTPQGIMADAGINPYNADVVESIMVTRTFPIRVGGNSGPLENEITWEQLAELTGGYVQTPEITTVTKKQRRIAQIDWALLERAVTIGLPTALAITFFDYLHPDVAGVTDVSAFEKQHWRSINEFEERLGTPVKYVSTGPNVTLALRVTA